MAKLTKSDGETPHNAHGRKILAEQSGAVEPIEQIAIFEKRCALV
jgi:hypothetical protein